MFIIDAAILVLDILRSFLFHSPRSDFLNLILCYPYPDIVEKSFERDWVIKRKIISNAKNLRLIGEVPSL